jgi:anti-repressor protein
MQVAQPLIAIKSQRIGSTEVQSVNARDLHARLEVRKDFSDWIKAQLTDLFTQDVDFAVFPLKGEHGQRRRIEYALTIECGKHIAMMSRTTRGREVRDYFIECERRAVAPAPTLSRLEILQLAIDSEQRALAAEALLLEQAPKADFYDKYTKAEGNKGIREVAKLLHANEREFVTFLRTNNIVYRLNGRLMPYSHQQGALRLDVKAGVAENSQAFQQAVFTPKGVTWIAAEWAKYQSVEV